MNANAFSCPICAQPEADRFRPFCSADCSNLDLERVRGELTERIDQLAEELLGPPTSRKPKTWRWGSKGSFVLEVGGRKRGLWHDKEAGQGGGPFDLICRALPCGFGDAVAWARQWTGGILRSGYQAEQHAWQAERDRKARLDAAAEADDAARRIHYARRLWSEATPLAGTLAETYLTKTRKIGDRATVWPDSLAFHAPSNSLIVAATLPDGTVQAAQRVRLAAGGRKAENTSGKPVKVTNGVLAGAVVRFPGRAGSPDPAPLLVGEGPETALSVWSAIGCEVWCALGSVAGVDLPDNRSVIITADDNPPEADAKRGAAARALAGALARWRGEGRAVQVVYPWSARRHDGSDFNDAIRELGPAAVRDRLTCSPTPEPPPPRRLTPYHQASIEPRAVALRRQRQIIAGTISDGAQRVAIQSEVRRRRDAEMERLEAEIWEEVTPQRKAALTRRFTRDVLRERGLTKVPRPQRVLITGSQGSGKTIAALQEIAAIRNDCAVWMTTPVLAKAEEAAADYRRLAGPNSLPAIVVRGRAAPDPHAGDGETMCRRSKMAERVARRGFSIRKLICPKCPSMEQCGSIRQERAIGGMQNRGVYFQARNYLSMQSPAPAPDILIADERITIEAVDDVLSISPGILHSAIPFPGASLAATIKGAKAIDLMRAALLQPEPLAVIRNSDTLVDDLRGALKLVEDAMDRHEPPIDGSMSDTRIISIIDELPINNLGKVAATVRAVLRELPTGRPALTAVQYLPACRVRVDGKEEEQPRILVHRLRRLQLPDVVLLLDGTGSAQLNRVLLPNLQHHHIPIERDAYVVGTAGKSYSRQSVTGCDRDGNPIPMKEKAAKRLRQEIATVTRTMPGDVLLAGSLQAVNAIRADGLLSAQVSTVHFGAVRGLNTWEANESGFVIGRESISLEQLECIGRAFLATDPVPFVSFARPDLKDWSWTTWPYRATRGRRMRDGSVEAVEVEVHPDPRVQEVLEQIREAEVLQASDRVRPIFNRRRLTLANDLALDVTYDRILSHAELVSGGTCWDRAWQATGVVPLGAADLHQVHAQIFPSQARAKDALAALKLSGGDLQIDIYLRNPPTYFRYRREGQRGSASRVAVDQNRHDNQRLAVEAFLGPLALFEPIEPLPPPKSPVSGPIKDDAETATIFGSPPAWFPDPDWVPLGADLPAADLARWEQQLLHEVEPDLPEPPEWLDDVPDWSVADLARLMADPDEVTEREDAPPTIDSDREAAAMPELQYPDADQVGLDPGAVYRRGMLEPPHSDEWLIAVPGRLPICIRGWPGVKTAAPRLTLLRPASPDAARREPDCSAIAVLSDELSDVRQNGPEPGG